MTSSNLASTPSANYILSGSIAPATVHLLPEKTQVSHEDQSVALHIRKIVEVPGGAYSNVFKAEMTTDGATRMVALKVLRFISSSERLHKREQREWIWATLRHDNIATFLGMYRESNGMPVFISTWYQNGTASEFLRRHPDVDPMGIIHGITCGIEYMHERGVIHGDLKGNNVLIDDDGNARISDFGLSSIVNSGPGLTTLTSTTLRWRAPELELSDDGRVTTASDVYALASTILELITGDIPYLRARDYEIYENLRCGRGPRPLSAPLKYPVPEDLLHTLDTCWSSDARLRPTARLVKQRIQALIHN